MQPQDAMFLRSWILIAILLLCAGVVAGIVVSIRHGYGKAILGAALVLGLLLSFVGLSFKVENRTHHEHQEAIRVENTARDALAAALETTQPASPPSLSGAPGPDSPSASSPSPVSEPVSGPAPQKIQYISGSNAPVEIEELPGWRKNPVNEGSVATGRSKYVLTSKQYASVEEAEDQLYHTLLKDVQTGFQYYWPETRGWSPTNADLASSGLIAEKIIETYPLKVGEFENTVYRVSWLVEFRPEVNHAIHASWYPIEAERRSKLVLSILAGISGFLGMSTLWLRRRRHASATETASPVA